MYKYLTGAVVFIVKLLRLKYHSLQLDFLSAMYMAISVYITYVVYCQKFPMIQEEYNFVVVDVTKMTPAARWWLARVIEMREYCDIETFSESLNLPYILPYVPWEDLKECIHSESLQYLTLYTKFYVAVTADVLYRQYILWYIFMVVRVVTHSARVKDSTVGVRLGKILVFFFGKKQDTDCQKQSVYKCILFPNSALAHFMVWVCQSVEESGDRIF